MVAWYIFDCNFNVVLVFHPLDSRYQCAYVRVGWPTVSHPLDRVGVVGVKGDYPSGSAAGGDIDGYSRRKQF